MEYKLPKNTNEILAQIGPVSVPEQSEYLKFHSARYKYLMNIVAKFIGISLLNSTDKGAKINADPSLKTSNASKMSGKILDIGTGFEVDLLRNIFKIPIDTAGFYHSGFEEVEGETFHELNLNDVDNLKNRVNQKYSLIILAEVIEHLYTSPELVLKEIKNWLNKEGILIIQTPNAVSLPKRLKMMFGIHPFEKIRLNSLNPGHFREYTLEELVYIVESVGFKVLFASRKNYFSPNNKFLKFLYSLEFLWPQSLRTGITVVIKR
jgi:SAM-dependent methyltransferase